MTKHDTCEYCDGKVEHRVVQARFRFKKRKRSGSVNHYIE